MRYQVHPLTNGVFALAIWDPAWKSYNNIYVVKRQQSVMLIDCGKTEHGNSLALALESLDIDPMQVQVVIATHGHHDHIGGLCAVPAATLWIHAADAPRVPEPDRARTRVIRTPTGNLFEFSYVHLGYHTDGSLALFDHASKILFIGDHWCFFGSEAPEQGFVSRADDLREQAVQLVRSWRNSPEQREKYRLGEFADGLMRLTEHQTEYLATGHGPVLAHDVRSFLVCLAAAARDP